MGKGEELGTLHREKNRLGERLQIEMEGLF